MSHLVEEERRGRERHVDAVMVGGKVEKDPAKIAKAVADYFQGVYWGHQRTDPATGRLVDTGRRFKPTDGHLPAFLRDLDVLDEEGKAQLDGNVNEEEVEVSVAAGSTGKSPGPDGLPYEFYQTFTAFLTPILTKVFNSQLKKSVMTRSFRQAKMKLIPKVKSTPRPDEFRPISLQNVDYKIMSRVFANRLTPVLDKIVSARQFCAVRNRQICDMIQEFLSVIETTDKFNMDAYMLNFDIFKAYDRTSVSFICKILTHVNCPQFFIDVVKLLHRQCFTVMHFNSCHEKIDVHDMLRQGDPLSAALFVINIDPLVRALDREVGGIWVGANHVKTGAFMDDITVFTTKLDDMAAVDSIFLQYEQLTGMVLSRTCKSKVTGLGKWANRADWPISWLGTEKVVRVLGFWLGPSVAVSVDRTWEKVVEAFRVEILAARRFDLPLLRDRLEFVNTFCLSKLWYVAHVMPLARRVADKLDKLVRAFLWIGHLEKLPWTQLYNRLEDGGLGVVNVFARGQAMLAKTLYRQLTLRGAAGLHLLYWLGLQLRVFFPPPAGPKAEVPTAFYGSLLPLAKEVAGLVRDGVVGNMDVTAKNLYVLFNSTPPPPRLFDKFSYDHFNVFSRIWSVDTRPDLCEFYFKLVNNILITPARLARMGLENATGLCSNCNVLADVRHIFTECLLNRDVWEYILIFVKKRSPMLLYLNQSLDMDVLMLNFEKHKSDSSVIPSLFFYARERFSAFNEGREIQLDFFKEELKVFLETIK